MADSSGLRFDTMTPGDLEGSIIGPVAHRVDGERIDAFVEATGDRPGRWVDHAPPGYAAALLFSVAGVLLNDQRIRPYLATLIHVDQQFTFHGPFERDATIEMTGTVERVRERGGAYFVTLAAAGAINGDVVLESRSTFLMSDQAAAESATDRREPSAGDRGPNEEAPDRHPPDVGRALTTKKSASRADLVRYAAATRDYNPLHWDHDTARAAGLDGVVVAAGIVAFGDLADTDDVANTPNATNTGYGVFVQDELRLSDDWSLTLGLRYAKTETKAEPTPGLDTRGLDFEDDAVVGALNFTYSITPNLKAVASYGTAFRAPSIVERLFNGITPEGAGFQILNPDLVICNMDPKVSLNLEIIIEKGRGYVPAEENKKSNAPLGSIAVDSIFTPVRNVK